MGGMAQGYGRDGIGVWEEWHRGMGGVAQGCGRYGKGVWEVW